MDKHTDKHTGEEATIRKSGPNRQASPGGGSSGHTGWSYSPVGLDRRLGMHRRRCWSELETIANTDDTASGYAKTAKKVPTLWPLPIEDGAGDSLEWSAVAQPLFNAYRDLLRGYWRRDPSLVPGWMPSGAAPERFSDFLFGTTVEIYRLFDEPFSTSSLVPGIPFFEGGGPALAHLGAPAIAGLAPAVAGIKREHPNARIASSEMGTQPIASFWPDWNTSTIRYYPRTDFQAAVWYFFCDYWRARVCPVCSGYFVAEKPAQRYCRVQCSVEAHRESARRTWRESGSKRRKERIADRSKTRGSKLEE